jgi:thymidylate synthase (FAD)
METSIKNQNRRISVLDHGFVQYVSHMGDDLTVVNAARVSFNKQSDWELDQEAKTRLDETNSFYWEEDLYRIGEKDKKLIKYLAEHNHWTPFAHPQITLRIRAPISIRTQFFKHKQGFVENEISRRYVIDEPEIYNPQWRSKPSNGAKQGSDDFILNEDKLAICDSFYKTVASESIKVYNRLIENGVAPEQARFVLPQGTYTEWWWTGSLAAYARVCKQRSDPHAQWEIREYASAIKEMIAPLFPVSWDYLT